MVQLSFKYKMILKICTEVAYHVKILIIFELLFQVVHIVDMTGARGEMQEPASHISLFSTNSRKFG